MSFREQNYKNLSIFNLSLIFWIRLNKKRKLQLLVFLILLLISSITEVVSIASVIPFISALSIPEKIYNIDSINTIATNLNINNANDIRLPITIAFCLIVILSGIIRLLNLWCSFRIAASIGSDISSEIFKKILYKPYLDFSNSGDYISTLNTEITRVINGIIIPQLILMSSSIICIFLFITLIIINFKATIISSLLIITFYYFSIIVSKNTLSKNSKMQVKYNQKVVRTIQESFGFIKEIILSSKYKFFIKKFDNDNYKLNLINSKSSFINTYPRILIEPVGIAILSMIGCIIVSKEGFNSALPLIGTLVIGSQRIIPLMQKIYEGIVKTKGSKTSLALILELLDKKIDKELFRIETNNSKKYNEDFRTFSSIEMRNVFFKYPNDSKYVLKNLNLKINRGDKIAIIGESGSGKSTLVDLLMGLIKPTEGEILINNFNISNCNDCEIRNWREIISLVSQTIYLSDSSIKENIAFGIETDEININKVNEVICTAKLNEFIETKQYGVETFIGENGISLSGGQAQRLGIARGLYKNADFLLLDEATSSLDYKTEKTILKNLSNLREDFTILMITHRETNLNFCNKIIKVSNGALIEINKKFL